MGRWEICLHNILKGVLSRGDFQDRVETMSVAVNENFSRAKYIGHDQRLIESEVPSRTSPVEHRPRERLSSKPAISASHEDLMCMCRGSMD